MTGNVQLYLSEARLACFGWRAVSRIRPPGQQLPARQASPGPPGGSSRSGPVSPRLSQGPLSFIRRCGALNEQGR
jgi:hypothetical protein